MKTTRLIDKLMEILVYSAGVAVMITIVAIFFYLAKEARFAYNRGFSYGIRFQVQADDKRQDISANPDSSLLSANPDGTDQLDDTETEASTLAMLKGYSKFGTATRAAGSAMVTKDDLRSPKHADKGDSFNLYAYATPEYRGKRMVLAWEPDNGFDPSLCPYRLTLRLKKAPGHTKLQFKEIDLHNMPAGRVEIPTYVATDDSMRDKGYVFELKAEPTTSNLIAVTRSLFRTDWIPTSNYPRFGIIPLVWGTLSITLLAMLMAVPLGLLAAVYLGELASSRVREWMKPVIELLSSVPTVVLGYFGLMLLAPYLQRTLGSALHMENGRAMLTAAIMMAVLILPTIITTAEDALSTVPNTLREAAEGLGLTPLEAISKVTLPAARNGLVSACLLGMARAIGETMIVWILAGGTVNMPHMMAFMQNLGLPVRGIADTIGIEMGNVDFEGVHYGSLFLLGLVLFSITLVVNLLGYRLGRSKLC